MLAHSDLTVKDAKVYVGKVGGQALPLIVSNTAPELPKAAAVLRHIEKLLDALYAQLPSYEQQYS